jgi:cell division septal protein FtsQ
MAKRMGANGRKKNAGRRSTKKTKRFAGVSLFSGAVAALLVAGFLAVGRYGHHFQSLVTRFTGHRSSAAQLVVIQGAVQVDPAALLKKCGIVSPVTIEELNKGYLAALRNANPWIEKIRIVGVRDGKIVLGICERKPVAMIPSRKGVRLVDANGVLLPLAAKTEYRLPLVSGLEDSVGENGICRLTDAGCSRMNGFFRDAAANDKGFIARVTQLNFAPPTTSIVRFMLDGCAAVVVADERDIAGCLEKFTNLWESVKNDSLPPARIDLAYRNLAFVVPETPRQPIAVEGPHTRKTKG